MDKVGSFLKKIKTYHEDDFSKEIVIPLLKEMGYLFTDFNGGPYEQGKDIIAFKINEFDEKEYTVVQSKMFRSSRSGSSRQKFGEICYQLRQCRDRKIPCIDGIERLPSKVIFITPYDIDTRHLEEQFATVNIKEIVIIDSTKLVTLLTKYWPSVFNDFEGEIEKAVRISKQEISNSELHNVLRINSHESYSDYYSDLNFFVGDTEGKKVFSSSIVITKNHDNKFDEKEWSTLKKVNHQLISCIGLGIINENIADVEKSRNYLLEKYLDERNQSLIKAKNILEDSAKEKKIALTNLLKSTLSDIDSTIELLEKRESSSEEDFNFLEKISDSVSQMESFGFDLSGLHKIEEKALKLTFDERRQHKTIINQISGILDLCKEIKEKIHEVKSISKDIVEHPKFTATTCHDLIESKVNHKINKIASGLSRLNQERLTAFEVRSILEEINITLRCVDNITNTLKCHSFQFELTKSREIENRLDISAHAIFDSGCNIAIYGEAGAGKSTTLHVYAEKLYSHKLEDEAVIFMPLNRITSKLNRLPEEAIKDIIDDKNHFNTLINSFLLYKEVPVSEKNREELINSISSKRKAVIIIDALDESATHASWVIPAISNIPKILQKSQVITSSRNCVKFIKDIEFLGVTLLPFRPEQLKRFIFGWIKEDYKKNELWQNIQNNSLFEIAKNPLLATILCTLYESGSPLPRSEPDVYRRKIELLCGDYDHHKDVKRAKTDRSFLEECCRKLAYQMHAKEQREAPLEEIFSLLTKGLEGKADRSKISTAIDDLISCCNILIYSPDSEMYGFGHLRIQEFLAAEELCRNRSIDIIRLISKPWWAGSLYLYSFENDIEPIINEVYEKHGSFTHFRKNIELMITARPIEKRGGLLQIMKRHEKLDDFFDEYSRDDISYSLGFGHAPY